MVDPDATAIVTVTFTAFDVECNYDFVFIYDGDSYDSPLLGSFSGDTLPDEVVASGNMVCLMCL
jgi:hypothetical protein